jgi:hypothetical protein
MASSALPAARQTKNFPSSEDGEEAHLSSHLARRQNPVALGSSPVTRIKNRSSGLPAFFSAFPALRPVTFKEKKCYTAYGGGSAPDFNGIPY